MKLLALAKSLGSAGSFLSSASPCSFGLVPKCSFVFCLYVEPT
jgi:hypothetical protein